ncbi:MAG: hypothetical protein ACHWZW_17910 [Spirulina sp.]
MPLSGLALERSILGAGAASQHVVRRAGLIVYVIELIALPWMSPAIATVVVLWILKIGLRTFCDDTEPAETQSGGW